MNGQIVHIRPVRPVCVCASHRVSMTTPPGGLVISVSMVTNVSGDPGRRLCNLTENIEEEYQPDL